MNKRRSSVQRIVLVFMDMFVWLFVLLWIYKIDKEIIYKGKIKYDISTKEGLKKLWKTEDYMRKIDERDGYPKHPWRKEIYAKKGGKIETPKQKE